MKLDSTQMAAAKDMLGADPIPEEHPVTEQLTEAFGPHTFYADQNGLLIFLDPETELESNEGGQPRLVLIARWSDEEKTSLNKVDPMDTGVTLPAAA